MNPDLVAVERLKKLSPHCPLCGHSGIFHATARDIEYFTTDTMFGFYHCSACDVLFISPMLADQLDLIYPSNYYSFQVSEHRNWVVRIKEMLDARMLRRVLRTIPGNEIRVLDVGGGTGWLSDLARQADPRISVTQIVDLDSRAQEIAETAGHRYFRGRIEDFAAAERFDLVLMLNLVEHVPQPETMLRHVNGLLSPRGRVLIKTPNFRALDAVIFKDRNWGGYHCPRHFVLFNHHSISRSLQRTGFGIESFAFTQGAPFWTISIMEMLRRAGWIRIGPQRTFGEHPLLPFINVATAAFDFLRRPFSPLSQMIVVARRDAATVDEDNLP